MDEVVVGRQQAEVMANAKLCQQSVDGADLNTCATAAVAQLSSVDVVLTVRAEQWQGGETFDDVPAGTWTRKALKQFLQHEPGGHDDLFAFECIA